MVKLIFQPLLKSGSLYLLMVLFLSGCLGPEKIPKPDNLIAEENYIDIMVEMQHINTYRNAQPDSVSADSLKALVYDRYGITEKQFLESHTYYQKHVNEQIARVDEALRRLENEAQYIQAHIDSVKTLRARQNSISQIDSTSIQ